MFKIFRDLNKNFLLENFKRPFTSRMRSLYLIFKTSISQQSYRKYYRLTISQKLPDYYTLLDSRCYISRYIPIIRTSLLMLEHSEKNVISLQMLYIPF
jgi:hypothetical protein